MILNNHSGISFVTAVYIWIYIYIEKEVIS